MTARLEMAVGARALVVTALVVAAGCGRKESSSSGLSTSSGPAVSAAPTAASAVVTAAVDAGPVDIAFEGTYTASATTLTRSPDAPAWSGDDAGTGLGAGTLSFRVDGATGRILGKGDGAFGPVLVSGQLGEGGVVTFALRRADATDGGFTGVGYGTRAGAAIQGTVRASTATGNVFREATFTVSAK